MGYAVVENADQGILPAPPKGSDPDVTENPFATFTERADPVDVEDYGDP